MIERIAKIIVDTNKENTVNIIDDHQQFIIEIAKAYKVITEQYKKLGCAHMITNKNAMPKLEELGAEDFLKECKTATIEALYIHNHINDETRKNLMDKK